MAMINVGDQVEFSANDHERCTGIVIRVWLKPVNDPYVTIRTEDGAAEGKTRIFTRCMSAVSAS